MLFVTRIGPLEIGEAFHIYLGFTESGPLDPLPERSPDAALRHFAAEAKRHGETELRCDDSIGPAARLFGFKVGEAPEMVVALTGAMSFSLALGPKAQVHEHHEECFQFLMAARAFEEAEPWQLWSDAEPLVVRVTGAHARDYEACIMGAGRQIFGLALYEEPGSLALLRKYMTEGHPEKGRKLASIAVTFDPEPAFALKPLERAFGLYSVPCPMKVHPRKGAVAVSPMDLVALTATLDACAQLSPEHPVATGKATLLGRPVSARVEAPPVRQ
jgi:hypothetical protein